MLNLNFVTFKRTFLRETASYKPSCLKSVQSFFL